MALLTMLILGLITIRNSNRIICALDRIVIDKHNIRKEVSTYLIFIIYLIYVNIFSNPFDIIIYSTIYLILYLISLIDSQESMIPDKYIVCILIIGLLNATINKVSIKEMMYSISPILFILILVLIIEKIMKCNEDEEVFGGGDIKLLFALSISMGLENILALLFLSHLLFILRNNKGEGFVPFAPYIYKGYIGMFLLKNVYSYLIF